MAGKQRASERDNYLGLTFGLARIWEHTRRMICDFSFAEAFSASFIAFSAFEVNASSISRYNVASARLGLLVK